MRVRRPGLWLLVMVAIAPGRASAQRAALTVRIVDSAGRPLPYAGLAIGGREGSWSADPSGVVASIRLNPRTYQFTARAIGYRPRTVPVSLAPGETRQVTIALVPSPYQLPDLVSTGPGSGIGDVYRRLRQRGGRIITRADIDRSGAITLPRLFEGVFGVRVENVPMAIGGETITFPGCRHGWDPHVAFWLDGREMIGSPYPADDIVHNLKLVLPRELEMIEVYRRREEIPGVFKSLDACAALVMWTRAFAERSGR